MALPTLPSRWKSLNLQDRFQKMQEQRNNFLTCWDDTAKYYRDTARKSNMQCSWTSDNFLRKNMSMYSTDKEKLIKMAALHKRRQKLFNLLQEETKQYQAELSGLSLGNHCRLQEMKERANCLKSSREEKNHEIAQQRLLDHWRVNNHELRKVESDLHQAHVKEAWSHQVTERKKYEKEQEDTDIRFANEYEQERLNALKNLQRKEEERKKAELERAEILKTQIQNLKLREKESEKLKEEEAEILNSKIKLEKLQIERENMNKKAKERELGRFLIHQCKAQLRRKAQQVQQELEFDRQVLNELLEKDEIMRKAEVERQEKLRQDIAWMKQVLEDQIKLEREREKALDEMYSEEARHVWEKREKEWRKESDARERLMKDVLDQRAAQLHFHQEENKLKQKKLLQEREQLIATLADAEKTSRQEKRDHERQKLKRRDELDQQATARKEKILTARQMEKDEIEAEAEAEAEYASFLTQEATRRKQLGYQEKQHARKKAWQ